MNFWVLGADNEKTLFDSGDTGSDLTLHLLFSIFFTNEGLNLGRFVGALFANGAAGGFTVDLLFTSFVFWVYMFYLRKKEGGPQPLLFIILNLTIGLSCAFPAYLYAKAD
jgi:hypothetical protein